MSDRHLSQPKFFLPSWSTKTWAYFIRRVNKYFGNGSTWWCSDWTREGRHYILLRTSGVRWQVQKTIELGNTSSSNIKPFVYVSSTTWLGRIGIVQGCIGMLAGATISSIKSLPIYIFLVIVLLLLRTFVAISSMLLLYFSIIPFLSQVERLNLSSVQICLIIISPFLVVLHSRTNINVAILMTVKHGVKLI